MPTLVAFFLFFPACIVDPAEDGCPPGFVASFGACTFDEDAILDLVATMDQGELTLVNPEPYYPTYANPIARNVWVSPIAVPDAEEELDAAALYLSIDQEGWGPALDYEFPVGTVIIHESVDRSEAHGIEVKRDDYVDDLGRDWWLRKIYDDGTYDEVVAEPCSDCHNENVRVTEGLWGIPASAKG